MNKGKMTVLTELKDASRDSIEAKQQELERILSEPGGTKDALEKELRDAILDMLSHVRSVYEVTVAQVRQADDLDEIAALWKDTHELYLASLTLWRSTMLKLEQSGAIPEPELFRYCLDLIEKLERASREHYQFHAE
jgi:hypothetical protein